MGRRRGRRRDRGQSWAAEAHGPHGFTLNGKGFPATEPLTAKLGQKVRIRFMHGGQMIHPMHLHGMPMGMIGMVTALIVEA